ncbi:MAG: GIY-YIG nuclease family protein [Candidatus Curtissbacteria bacterium]|nr:GIY-YIG nuclease family protein [Candidatus Curtissbacteria bacterium]
MYQVYILRSLSNGSRSYVGLTLKGIKNRLKEHNAGESRYTKTYIPWELVYFENFYCRLCAEKREKFLKSGFGYRFRKLILEKFKAG